MLLEVWPNRFDDWTGEMRRNQMSRLEAAREHDRTAVEALGKALDSLESTAT